MTRLAIIALAWAASAGAQGPAQPPAPGAVVPIEQLRADFRARSGGDFVYFELNGAMIGASSRPMLAAQAEWLRLNPFMMVKIEGHGDGGDTRDHALALGARRAAAVREAYILLGVPASQIAISSWGSERPGPARAEIRLVP